MESKTAWAGFRQMTPEIIETRGFDAWAMGPV